MLSKNIFAKTLLPAGYWGILSTRMVAMACEGDWAESANCADNNNMKNNLTITPRLKSGHKLNNSGL
jgi:hypothetical protein